MFKLFTFFFRSDFFVGFHLSGWYNLASPRNVVLNSLTVGAKKISMNENNNNNNNSKNIDDDVTSVIEYDTTIKNVFAKSMDGELLIVI